MKLKRKQVNMETLGIFGNEILLPTIGDKVLRGGCVFSVIEVVKTNDTYSVASIVMRGESGTIEIGYYDFLKHAKF